MPLRDAIKHAGPRPKLNASKLEKSHYSKVLSKELALEVASELRDLGLKEVATRLTSKKSPGGEETIAGGLGEKSVDITYATKRADLVLAISIKTVSFPNGNTRNYQRSLRSATADLAFEAATLHKRFPYAVIGGLLFLHEDASGDDIGQARISTFDRAHQVLKILNQRAGHRDEEAKFERLCVGLYSSCPPDCQLFEAGDPEKLDDIDSFLFGLLALVAERNADQFVYEGGSLYELWGPRIEGGF